MTTEAPARNASPHEQNEALLHVEDTLRASFDEILPREGFTSEAESTAYPITRVLEEQGYKSDGASYLGMEEGAEVRFKRVDGTTIQVKILPDAATYRSPRDFARREAKVGEAMTAIQRHNQLFGVDELDSEQAALVITFSEAQARLERALASQRYGSTSGPYANVLPLAAFGTLDTDKVISELEDTQTRYSHLRDESDYDGVALQAAITLIRAGRPEDALRIRDTFRAHPNAASPVFIDAELAAGGDKEALARAEAGLTTLVNYQCPPIEVVLYRATGDERYYNAAFNYASGISEEPNDSTRDSHLSQRTAIFASLAGLKDNPDVDPMELARASAGKITDPRYKALALISLGKNGETGAIQEAVEISKTLDPVNPGTAHVHSAIAIAAADALRNNR